MHQTIITLSKRGRLISTRHGMRRILKQTLPVKEFIEKAVNTGIYRSREEIDQYMKDMRDSQTGDVDPRVVNWRFRNDYVRGVKVQGTRRLKNEKFF